MRRYCHKKIKQNKGKLKGKEQNKTKEKKRKRKQTQQRRKKKGKKRQNVVNQGVKLYMQPNKPLSQTIVIDIMRCRLTIRLVTTLGKCVWCPFFVRSVRRCVKRITLFNLILIFKFEGAYAPKFPQRVSTCTCSIVRTIEPMLNPPPLCTGEKKWKGATLKNEGLWLAKTLQPFVYKGLWFLREPHHFK